MIAGIRPGVSIVPISFLPLVELDTETDCYRAVLVDENASWSEDLADEYLRLRTDFATPLEEGLTDGITVLDSSEIEKRLRRYTVPAYGSGNFDVVRSDFGEILSYRILEEVFGTQFPHKPIRSRELIDRPARGIDAVGIENGEQITIVICETKVSSEGISPPRVVDRNEDSLRIQHRGHLQNRRATLAKLWEQSRQALNTPARDLLMAALLRLDQGRTEGVRFVACSVLVRPRDKYTIADFGTFRSSPDDFRPAMIRFLVVCLGNDLDSIIQEWYDSMDLDGGAE